MFLLCFLAFSLCFLNAEAVMILLDLYTRGDVKFVKHLLHVHFCIVLFVSFCLSAFETSSLRGEKGRFSIVILRLHHVLLCSLFCFFFCFLNVESEVMAQDLYRREARFSIANIRLQCELFLCYPRRFIHLSIHFLPAISTWTVCMP